MRWICHIHLGNSPHGNVYSWLDVGAQMSQINLFRALPQDSRQPSVTIPKNATGSKALSLLYSNMEDWASGMIARKAITNPS